MNSNNCPACGHSRFIALEKIEIELQHQLYSPNNNLQQDALNKAAQKTASKYEMRRCNQCNLEYASPLKAPSADWYSIAYDILQLYPSNRWEFDFVLNNHLRGPILELGCGSGEFIKKSVEKGYETFGLDFSPDAIRKCKDVGFSVDLLDFSNNDGTSFYNANVITAFHVLEHLDNPASFFRYAKSQANVGSKLWIAVPSCKRPSRLLGLLDFLDQPPHHMTRWNEDSLKHIGEPEGWLLDKVYYEPISIRTKCWYISINLKFYKFFLPAVVNLRILEMILRLVLYPFAFILGIVRFKNMTGFTMLACFTSTK